MQKVGETTPWRARTDLECPRRDYETDRMVPPGEPIYNVLSKCENRGAEGGISVGRWGQEDAYGGAWQL